MKAFARLTSVAAPLIRDNVDTDAIIPSREMRSTGKSGLAAGLFAPWRYRDADAGLPDPDFVLNQPEYAGAKLLLSGRNFGCGSSREHAVWALLEHGIACVIAESFAPIFRNNCLRNGLLPVELGREAIRSMAGMIVTVDLAAQSVAHGDGAWPFEIDPESKTMLLKGLDAIDLTLEHRDAITAWQAADRARRPWVYLNPPRDGEGDRQPAAGGGGGPGLERRSAGPPPPAFGWSPSPFRGGTQ